MRWVSETKRRACLRLSVIVTANICKPSVARFGKARMFFLLFPRNSLKHRRKTCACLEKTLTAVGKNIES
jgi:hypothetical protein